MLVLVRVLMLMLVLVWMWGVMGGRRRRSQGCGRRGRLGRRRVLIRRGHVLRERRHGLERVLRLVVLRLRLRLLGRRVAVLLVVVRRVCEWGRGRMRARLEGRHVVRVVADVFLLAREPFAQH